MWSDDFTPCSQRGMPAEVLRFEMPLLEGKPLFGLQDAALPDPAEKSPGKADEREVGAAIAHRLETLERDAFEKGFKAGEEAGLAMGEQRSLVLLEKLENMIKELSDFRAGMISRAEPHFVELALCAARQIIIEELTVNPEAIARIAREALSKMQPQGKITIRTSPSILEIISRHKPELLGGHADIVFESDPGAPRFGCVIEGQQQEVVTDIDSQLKNLIMQMADQVSARDKVQTEQDNKN